MNFRPPQYYKVAPPAPVHTTKDYKVYFRDDGELAVVLAQKAVDYEDAINFTKEVITGSLDSKQAFLTVIQGGKA